MIGQYRLELLTAEILEFNRLEQQEVEPLGAPDQTSRQAFASLASFTGAL